MSSKKSPPQNVIWTGPRGERRGNVQPDRVMSGPT
jgi:hypothetical protein